MMIHIYPFHRALEKSAFSALATVISFIFFSACSSGPTKVDSEVVSSSSDRDYFESKAEIEYATNFSVSYHGNYKIVKTGVTYGAASAEADSASWVEAFTDVMVLVQKGTPVPSLTGELQGAHVIEIPVSTIAGNADDAPTRYIALKVTDRLVGLGHEAVYDSLLRDRFVKGELKAIGPSWHTGPDLETLVTLKPEVTLLTAASLEQADGVRRSRALGLKVAPEFSWSETTYLGQLEWIKYDALFLNVEATANDFFENIKSRCDSLAGLVANRTNKPSAMWGMHSRSGSWTVRSNGGIADLIREAGGINPFDDANAAITETKANGLSEGITISDEVVLGRGSEIDFIISFQSSTENWPPNDYMSIFPAYQGNGLYHHFTRYRDYGAYDWYQTAPMRPDLLLSDLIKLFHPEVLPDHELYFLGPIQRVQ